MAGFANALAPLSAMLVEAVLNGLWQGMFLAGLTWLLVRAIPQNPRIRCAAWYACLVAIIFLPVAHLAVRLWSATTASGEVLQEVPPLMPCAGYSAPVVHTGSTPVGPAISLPSCTAFWLLLAWAAFSSLLGVRLVLSYRNVARLKRKSKTLPDADTTQWARRFAACHTRRRFELRSSEEVRLPMLAGLARPAILFPLSLFPLLSIGEKRRICLHELAHIRRCDDWSNLFQKAAEALLFFHPAIRWIGKRLCLERELACDDWVVSVSGAARPYAACLIRLADLVSLSSHPFPALGSASDRKQIQRRIEMLLNPKRNERRVWSRFVFTCVIVACLTVAAVAARMNPVIAFEDPPAAVTGSPTPPALAAPPAPPAPPLAPATPSVPQASAVERKVPVQAAGQSRETDERIQTAQEEIHKLTEEIRKEVEGNLKAKTEEIQRLAEQIREKVQQSVQPQVREISELAGKLAQEETASPRNEEQIRRLQEEIKEHEIQIDRVSEQEVKGLEQRIHQLEEAIRPSEEQIRGLERKIREIEKQMREKEREIRHLREGNAPPRPAAPAPPAPPH